jgi:hypothetical protein
LIFLQVAWVTTLPVALVLALALLGGAGAGRAMRVMVLLTAVGGLAGDAAMLAWQARLDGLPVPAEVIVSQRGRSANAWTFEYAYDFHGQHYEGSRLTYRPRLRSRGDTDALAKRYPKGAAITVHVDPVDPSESVVENQPSYTLGGAGLVIHGALLLAFGRAFARDRSGADARA